MSKFKLLRASWWKKIMCEAGTASVEFAIVVWVFLLIFVSSFELGMATMRLTMLEHGLDKAMRDVRLGTATTFTRDEIRDRVCNYAGLLKDCQGNLLLEMQVIDRTTFSLPPVRATCIDKSQPAIPVTDFVNGADSDLMFIRACYVIDPLYPKLALGAMLKTDPAGNLQLVASSIFAQEPS
ncbi:MAG: pilus assembly protein [Litoreibacter sp.]|nr:pilus assembly protein [Litoreibacter sp.]